MRPSSSVSSVALVALILALLGAFVWVIAPSRAHLTPAPLHPMRSGCPKGPAGFIPTNITEIPNIPLNGLTREQQKRVIFRLNMEGCNCGCGLSLAACQVTGRTCGTAAAAIQKIIAEEKAKPPGNH